MPYVGKKRYEELLQYYQKKDEGQHGIDKDFLRFVCSANNYNAEEIGKYFLELLARINSQKE